MKSDSSRDTFDRRKHFSGVRMQQGRVQLDADWNEQHDIAGHRVRTEAADVIGACGGPLHHAAFEIVGDASQLTAGERALPENAALLARFAVPDFLIRPGRYYVDGLLCENERLTSYLNQPDLPDAPAIKVQGLYVVYVDVWQRHLTALDDPSIREIALGGPDTATRTKTVWQVKHCAVGAATGNCLTTFPELSAAIAPGDGRLSARTTREQASASPCIVPPGAGYLGLENQLYRIEVHDGGAALDATGSGFVVTRVPNARSQVKFTGGGAAFPEGQAVEVFANAGDPMNGTLAYIVSRDDGAKTLTLDIDVSDLAIDELRLRAVNATYKWSRNNGAIVTAIERIEGEEVTVHDLGPDTVLGFKEGQWVEISDDRLELNGRPGQLAQVRTIDRVINVITLSVAATPLSGQAGGVDKAMHPKLRGWEGIGAMKFHPKVAEEHDLEIEDGVRVRFFPGSFKTGDYWNVPARTATADTQAGNIEWPIDAGGGPLAQLPFGITHRYCRLAMLHWDGTKFDSIEDCRHLFPPVTELTSLFYVSGDGQEAMPDLSQLALLTALPQPVVVGAANGSWPVANAKVRLHVTVGGGRVLPGAQGGVQVDPTTVDVRTDAHGLASGQWQLDSLTRIHHLDPGPKSQQLTATLLDAADQPVHLPVIFSANLSVADQVAYDPGQCGSLQGQKTVQEAITRLSQLMSLYKISGDGQEIIPTATLAPLRVLVANGCGPVTDPAVRVTFTIVGPGTGKLTDGVAPDAGSISIPVGAASPNEGVAACLWKPDFRTPFQEVEAKIEADASHPVVPPTAVRFSATLNLISLYEAGGNNQEVMPGAVLKPLRVLAANDCGAVRDQTVRFTVAPGSGSVSPVEATTGADGIATTTWTLDASTPRQEVTAELVDLTPPSIAPPTFVVFTANLSVAAQVAYTPDADQCPDLAKAAVTTVKEALDELCKRTTQAEPGVVIKDILTAPDKGLLINDTLVAVSRLKRPATAAPVITIVCDRPVVPESVGAAPSLTPPFGDPDAVPNKPTCVLTVDLPYPLGADAAVWDLGTIFGFQSVIVAGSVSVKENQILWTPTTAADTWLQSRLFQTLRKLQLTDRVLAHLTLKGNFIWSEIDKSPVYLDGDAFGVRGPGPASRTNLRLPTGDGRSGGTFEMWFWLVASNQDSTLVLKASAAAKSIRGSVTDSSQAVVPGVQVTVTNTATGLTATAVTDGQGAFIVSNLPSGSYRVSVQSPDGSTAQTQVTVA